MDSKHIRNKYTGEIVTHYEAKREGSKKWHNEHDAVELLLNKTASSSEIQKLLDIPVGTGRFFELYENLGIEVVGADISEDMISKSREKANKDFPSANISFQYGNILENSTIKISPDLVICIRLLNWFSFNEVARAMNNINELDTKYVIVGIRTQSNENLGFKRKLWLLQAQIIHRLLNLRKFNNKNSINIHPEYKFNQLLQGKFNIQHRILVDVGTLPETYGSEYYIYLLKAINK